ncbi:MAG TPA: decarboxylating 6-phosphogluconate dehydrogenase [Steroidobacteraceae bacterium]
MQIGMIGLGRMGGNMARRLALGGADVVAFDRSAEARESLAQVKGVATVASLAEFVQRLKAPRIVWLMLPAGAVTEETLSSVASLLASGDLVVDGGNAHYRDAQRRAKTLAQSGVQFADAGVSGGVWGLEYGYGLMVGGAPAAIERLAPFLRVLAPGAQRGWLHCGPVGAGHFVKMVHNGIEYGMMQSYAEGFALLQARSDLELDVAKIAESWRYGTVIRSWLLDLTAGFLAQDSKLDSLEPFVADSGEGRWTAVEAIELGVPTPVMSLALMMRFASQGRADYASRLLARMRQGFGGHATKAAAAAPATKPAA